MGPRLTHVRGLFGGAVCQTSSDALLGNEPRHVEWARTSDLVQSREYEILTP